MKRNKFLRALVIIGIILGVLVQFRVVQFYKIPEDSMAPTIKSGALQMALGFLPTDKGDIVAYSSDYYGTDKVFLGRLMAKGGDVLEIKDGRAYVNGTNVDEGRNLTFLYNIHNKIARENPDVFKGLGRMEYIKTEGTDSALVFLHDEQYKSLKGSGELAKRKLKMKSSNRNSYPFPNYENWTDLDFGPLEIPVGHVFILGDSRNNSEDSRFRGFSKEEDIIGKFFK